MGLWGGIVFVGVDLFPGLCGFFLAAHKTQWQSGPQSTSWREGPTKELPTTMKTQLHTENQHKSKKDIHLHQISNARSPMGLFKKRETNSEKEKDKGTKGVKWQ